MQAKVPLCNMNKQGIFCHSATAMDVFTKDGYQQFSLMNAK